MTGRWARPLVLVGLALLVAACSTAEDYLASVNPFRRQDAARAAEQPAAPRAGEPPAQSPLPAPIATPVETRSLPPAAAPGISTPLPPPRPSP